MTSIRFTRRISVLTVIAMLVGLLGAAGVAGPQPTHAASGTIALSAPLNDMDSATNSTGDTVGTAGIALVANSDPAYIQEGDGSKKWLLAIDDPGNPGNLIAGSALIYPKLAPNIDLNGYTTLSFWAYSAKARTGGQADKPIQLRFFMKGDSSNYYYYRMPLDWTGWKQVEVPLDVVKTLSSSSAVKPWGALDYVRFDQAGVSGTTLDPELQVYLDDFRLTGEGELHPVVADQPSGQYVNKVTVALSSATQPQALSRIYYQRLGLDADFQPYTEPLLLTEDTTLVAKSRLGGVDSEETTYTYTFEYRDVVEEVVAAPPAGTYAEPKQVSLTSDTVGAAVYYRYEGEDDAAYRIYTDPVLVDESATLVTKAVYDGKTSEVTTHPYEIDLSGISSYPISDMEGFAGWTNTTPTAERAVLGERSGYWQDPTNAINVTGFDAPWKDYDQVEFWLYSEYASNKKVYFILDANIPETPAFDYFMTSFFVDWTGWKKIEIPYNKFLNSTGSADLDNFNQIIIHHGWYGSDPVPSPDDELYFDGLALAKNVVEPSIKQITKSALPGSTLHYRFTLKNIGAEATAYAIVPQAEFGAGYTASYDAMTASVAVGEETDLDIEVQVPASAAEGDTAQATFAVRPVAGGKEIKLELEVQVGAERVPTMQHPYIMLTQSELDDARDKVATYDWAADYLTAIRAEADEWLNKAIYYPTKPAGQTTWFACGDEPLVYDYDSPHAHLCPTDNEYYTGDEVDAGWRFTTHTLNVEAARKLALVYALTGETPYAAKAKEILVRYAELYPGYPVQPQYGKLFFQTLDEAVQMIKLVQAYDLIAPSGLLSAEETHSIERNLFAASAQTLQGYDVGKSNWQTWHNAAIGAVGAALEDEELMDFSVNGRSGFDYQMDNSVLADGFWYEGAIGYHFYAQSALLLHAQSLKNVGYDLFGYPNFKKTFDATLQYMYPDLGIINSNDSGKYPTHLGKPGHTVPKDYEAVYAQYEDPIYGTLLDTLYGELGRPRGGHVLAGNASSAIVGEEAVFYGKPVLPSGGELPSESLNFEGLGHSVIRVGEGEEQLFALVDYGLHGGYHGHPDKLHLDVFGQGERLAPDPGIPPYSHSMYEAYYKKTFPHNTVMVDGQTQAIPSAGGAEIYEPTKLYLPSDDFGSMTNTATKAYPGMNRYERTVAVTPDYMIDLFALESDTSRQYDWILHGVGELTSDPSVQLDELDSPLGTEDAYSYFRDGESAELTGPWSGAWHTTAGNGLRMISLTSAQDSPSTMIVGEAPGTADDPSRYSPVVVNRVEAASAQFVTVLEPLGDGGSQIASARRLTDDRLEVKLLDGRTNLFAYGGESEAPGELQYALVDGTAYDAEQVALPTAELSGATVGVTMPEQAGVERVTAVVYAPGATAASWNGETVPFTTDGAYVLIQSPAGDDPGDGGDPADPADPGDSDDGDSPDPGDSDDGGDPDSGDSDNGGDPHDSDDPSDTEEPGDSDGSGDQEHSDESSDSAEEDGAGDEDGIGGDSGNPSDPDPLPVVRDLAEDHWAKRSIETALRAGIVRGFGDGSVRPDAPVTRQQFVVMLINGLRSMLALSQADASGDGTSPSAQAAFADGEAIAPWAADAAQLAAELGLVGGYADGRFQPQAPLTRAELAVVLAKALDLKADAAGADASSADGAAAGAALTDGAAMEATRTDESATGPQPVGPSGDFTDASDIPAWARAAVELVQRAGLMTGRPGNRFDPLAPASRAEAITVVLRLLEDRGEMEGR
ncbi:S-layer homology domain-containing protein [Paenibacillus sp. IB182496]|uniref:S-layer homology domain-containing protein n=1 Tax=Paenibacillus sabuli TaxID=2772509 RepID=A0A927GTW3_9BACL|nr:S-layer homology domain-containing protein [Paenibacillus sabuli]MBD2847112.1 S-layer homology domain-containing protein [Paenibacillus sabuli]